MLLWPVDALWRRLYSQRPMVVGNPDEEAPPALISTARTPIPQHRVVRQDAETTLPARGCSILLAILLCCSLADPLSASDSTEPPTGYAVTVWTIKDGLSSGDIRSIAQDADGYLWLGTRDGLIRFDGSQFVSGPDGSWPVHGTVVTALLGARDGSLWAGFADVEGVSRLRNGQAANYGARNGLPEGMITVLIQDHEGTLWAGGLGGLSAFRDSSWSPVGSEAGLPTLSVFSLYEDRSGTLWAGTSEGVFQRPPGAVSFQLYDGASKAVQGFAQDPSGTLWITEARTIVRQLGTTDHHDPMRAVHLPGLGSGLLFDQRGALWVAGLGEGLFRISQPGRNEPPVLEPFQDERLVGVAARSLFQDRENNVWVGMRGGGLLRLSQSNIKTNLPLQGLTNDGVRAIASTPDGSVWVATGHRLNQFADKGTRAFPVDGAVVLHTDRAGALWVVAPRAVGRFVNGRLIPVAPPPGINLERTISLTTDAHGALWFCNFDDGVLRWENGSLTRFNDLTVSGHRRCSFLLSDTQDRVWAGFTTGGAAVYENGRFRLYEARDGLASGSVATIYQDHLGSIWLATVSGLTRIRDKQITTITSRHGLPGKIVPSFIEDARGDLWLGTESGSKLVRFTAAEVDRVAADSSHQLTYEAYDESDGLLGPLPRVGRPAVTRGPDGRLWVFSGGRVVVIDPVTLRVRRNVLTAHLERVAIDGQEVQPSADVVMAAGARIVQIDYGAISLSSASKLRFRYRLDGIDDQWVNAGSRRQISFTNLQPGNYRFHVAVTSDGVWPKTDASWGFKVPPPFYRTSWFYALALGAVAAAAWILWWLRVRAIRNEFALVLAERARVSREIHDTLLQSLGALTLQLEIVYRQLDVSQTKARQTMQRLRKHLVECVRDARRSVWELRSIRLEERNLVDALEAMAEETKVALPVSVRVEAKGRIRQCPPDVEQHLLRIAQEAISNAVQHGRADEVVVELDFQGNSLTMTIRDNGCGFETEPEVHAGDHWGLVNMRERVARIRGQLTVTSALGQGTIITATSPI
jgi:signal transduction histidine kinase/streptogramin lyase